MLWKLIIVIALVLDLLIWLPAITAHHNMADHVCPLEKQWIRYPEHLGGSHYAVCNPTGIEWRR